MARSSYHPRMIVSMPGVIAWKPPLLSRCCSSAFRMRNSICVPVRQTIHRCYAPSVAGHSGESRSCFRSCFLYNQSTQVANRVATTSSPTRFLTLSPQVLGPRRLLSGAVSFPAGRAPILERVNRILFRKTGIVFDLFARTRRTSTSVASYPGWYCT